jgi:hypothetical protein
MSEAGLLSSMYPLPLSAAVEVGILIDEALFPAPYENFSFDEVSW